MILLTKMRFVEFYYTDDKQLHDLYEVQKEYKEKKGDISKYRGKMFCPECKIAELSFTHQTSHRREFLSKKPSSEHLTGCSYRHEYASKRELKQFAKSLDEKQIQDRLEAALNQLMTKKTNICNIGDNRLNKNPFIMSLANKKGSRIRKSIPRKSVLSWFDKSEKNKIFIFYGRVKLECEEVNTKNGTRFRLIIYIKKQNEWKRKTSIYRDIIKDKIDPEKFYDIAVLGEINFYNGFPQIKTVTFNSIMLRELDV